MHTLERGKLYHWASAQVTSFCAGDDYRIRDQYRVGVKMQSGGFFRSDLSRDGSVSYRPRGGTVLL